MTQRDTNLGQAIAALAEPLVDRQGPGMVLAVAQHGQVLYRAGLGLASIGHGMPNERNMTPATRVRIGSITKQFTCLAALLLAEEGLLDADAPIGRYLPELMPPASGATLRQLMWHTGGIRCHIEAGLLVDGLALHPAGAALAMLARAGVNFPPGERMMYSNGGYHLLSLAMERVARLPLAEILASRIFRPLGMHATCLVASDAQVQPGCATLYTGNAEAGYRRGIFPSEELLGEGGMVSTVDDMLLWAAHLRNPAKMGTVGTEATWRQMLETPYFASGFTGEYALGLFLESRRGIATVNHAGNVLGGASHLLAVPSHGLDIVIMTNGAQADPIELAGAIADVVLAAHLGPDEPWARAEWYPHLVGDYYAPGSGMVVSLAECDGMLALGTCYDRPNPLVLRQGALELTFSRNSAGHYTVPLERVQMAAGLAQTITVCDCGVAQAFERLPAVERVFDAALAGRYRCEELGAVADVAADGHMEIRGGYGVNRLVLDPVAAEVLRLSSIDPGMPRGGVARVLREGGQAVLSVNLSRTRGLRFVREGETA